MKRIVLVGPQLAELGEVEIDSIAANEQVVVVSHGIPSDGDLLNDYQDLIGDHLWAWLVAQSGHPAPPIRGLRAKLTEYGCTRVFGLSVGWDTVVSRGLTSGLLAFLSSDEEAPNEPELQRILGLDEPVRRLAIRVAVEITQAELSKAFRDAKREPTIAMKDLLAPAIELANSGQALGSTAMLLERLAAETDVQKGIGIAAQIVDELRKLS